MSKNLIPVCFHPTTVAFCDDNRRYLDKLLLKLNHHIALYQLWDDPKRLIHYLQTSYQPNSFTQLCISHPEEDYFEKRHIEVDVRKIREQVYQPRRFDEISVLVMDYVMPSMNGVELCRALSDVPIKKLMLTGEGDESLAVNAFNEGLIDKFIMKSDRDFYENLNHSIFQLQYEYFQDLSKTILNSITENLLHHPNAILSNPVYQQFFKKILKNSDFSEFYLTDPEGSFMFLDQFAAPTWLAVKDQNGLRSDFETARFGDPLPNPAVLTALKQHELMLYAFSDSDQEVIPADWLSQGLLHQAAPVENSENLFYSLIHEAKTYQLEKQVMAFHTRLKQEGFA